MSKSLILCNCQGSQLLDAASFASLDSVTCSKIYSGLCTHQSEQAAEAISQGNVVIACQQERAHFEELAEALNVEEPTFVDLRDRAGWSDESSQAGPKMAALVADALHSSPATKSFDITSEGLCLILGPTEVALDAARRLSEHLSVTVLLENADDAPSDRSFDVILGTLKSASGALGHFSVHIDALQQLEPAGRGAFQFGAPQDGGSAACDVVLDLRGGTPLFPAPQKRDGYLFADPRSLPAVATAIQDASHMIGTFEKPFYLSYEPLRCAHSRAGQPACSNCLDVCPTGAIRPNGEAVEIDPNICAGCGSCAALCPSGAISFDAPSPEALFQRIALLAQSYIKAGGHAPRLLVHDDSFGSEMISLAARFGRGLPADVIPLALEKVSGFGHAEMLAALASGFAAVDVLVSPTTERDALDLEVPLAQALAPKGAVLRLLDPAEPDALSDQLYGVEFSIPTVEPILPQGSRRQVARLAVQALHPNADAPLPLPAKSPYGAVLVDTEACTLCLSCASLCPAGALGDNPDMPQLRFQEEACLQCGLCVGLCPENAITLVPQMDISTAALSQKVLHEEEPYCCVECSKPFGVKSTIEKIVTKLEGKHAMFANSAAARLIRMCDDCRVNAQYHMENNPMTGAERPRVRTSEDYLSKRRDH